MNARKMLIFRALGATFIDSMSWAGCQNNPIDVNFYLQKSLEIFEKKSAENIWSNKFKRIKMSCPVPDRVKVFYWLSLYHKSSCTKTVVYPLINHLDFMCFECELSNLLRWGVKVINFEPWKRKVQMKGLDIFILGVVDFADWLNFLTIFLVYDLRKRKVQ